MYPKILHATASVYTPNRIYSRYVLVSVRMYVFHYTNCPEIVPGKRADSVRTGSYRFATRADNLGRNQA